MYTIFSSMTPLMEHVRFSLFISVPHPKPYHSKGIQVFSSFLWGCPHELHVTISTAADNIILLTLLRSYCHKLCPPVKLQTIFFFLIIIMLHKNADHIYQFILCCCINCRKQTNVQCLSLYSTTTTKRERKQKMAIYIFKPIYVHFFIELLVNLSHVFK